MSVTPQCILGEHVQPDSVLVGFELKLQRTFYPWGFPFELETNSLDVMEAAEQAWGVFQHCFEETPVRLSIAVTDSKAPVSTARSVFASREHLMSLYGDAENFLLFDFRQGFGFGCVTRGTAADHPLLRYRFLTAALMLVEQRSLAPLHGALIVKNGAGVLLCGDSMAGKSTLTYACCRSGWTYVTDDGMSLVRSRSDRYGAGDYTTLRLREDARKFFPELAAYPTVVRPNGKLAIELFPPALAMATLPGHTVDHVVFLDRQEHGEAWIQPFPPEQALGRWEQYASFGAHDVRSAQKQCQRRLMQAGVWEMRYSSPAGAVAQLNELLPRAHTVTHGSAVAVWPHL